MASSGKRNSRRSKAQDSGKASRPIYVNHNYRDHYYDPIYCPDDFVEIGEGRRKGPRGGVITPFPERLYNMLGEADQAGFSDVVSWQPHGRCFIIHDPKQFVESVMPKYFSQSKLTSFQRQVNLYGFRRLTAGADRGAYYHELFLRGRPDILKRLVRIRIKGTGSKSAASPDTEPDFYQMHPCLENAAGNMTFANSLTAPQNSDKTEAAEQQEEQNYTVESMDIQSSRVAVTPPLTPLKTPTLVSFGDFKSLGSPADAMENHSMTLKSFAPRIIRSEACPITPDSFTSLVTTSVLDHEKMMVSPFQSPCPSPCPSVGGLESSPIGYFEEPLSECADEDYETWCNGIQNPFSENALILDNHAPVDCSNDPLLLLDEIVGPSF